jgi:dUTP pyrophosphatase
MMEAMMQSEKKPNAYQGFDYTVVLDVKFSGTESPPIYQTAGSAGCDLVANNEERVSIAPQGWEIIPTGLFLEMPKGFEAQIRSRSGLAAKHGVMVLNEPGTIDNDYRGEIKVILKNTGHDEFIVKKGDRIAQLVFSPIFRAEFRKSDSLSDTTRAAGGFGSTGT